MISGRSADAQGLSVVIPSWNGLELLTRNLPAVIANCNELGRPFEIIVVDDGSTDGTHTRLPRRFPKVRMVRKNRNEGYPKAANTGMREAVHEQVFMLATDIEPLEHCLEILCARMDKEVFAAQAIMISPGSEKAPRVHGARFRMVLGIPYYAHPAIESAGTTPIDVDFFNTGCAVVSRSKFLEVGGFDERFSPAYFEDLDLGIRVRARGWRMRLCPDAKVIHEGSATTRRKDWPWDKSRIHRRNYFLFVWKALSLHPWHWTIHPVTFPPFCVYRMLRGDRWMSAGFIAALRHVMALRFGKAPS